MAAGCWSTPLGRVGSSLSFFPVSCKVLRSGCTRIGEVIIVILGVTCEFLVAISKHEIDGCWRGDIRVGGRHWKKDPEME